MEPPAAPRMTRAHSVATAPMSIPAWPRRLQTRLRFCPRIQHLPPCPAPPFERAATGAANPACSRALVTHSGRSFKGPSLTPASSVKLVTRSTSFSPCPWTTTTTAMYRACGGSLDAPHVCIALSNKACVRPLTRAQQQHTNTTSTKTGPPRCFAPPPPPSA
jgi:hypothetical protein